MDIKAIQCGRTFSIRLPINSRIGEILASRFLRKRSKGETPPANSPFPACNPCSRETGQRYMPRKEYEFTGIVVVLHIAPAHDRDTPTPGRAQPSANRRTLA